MIDKENPVMAAALRLLGFLSTPFLYGTCSWPLIVSETTACLWMAGGILAGGSESNTAGSLADAEACGDTLATGISVTGFLIVSTTVR